MPWTDRQHAILREMGLRVWSMPAGPVVPDGGPPEAAVDAQHAPTARAPAASTPDAAPVGVLPAVAAGSTQTRAVRPVSAPSPARTPPPGDNDRAVARMDWPTLRATVAACEACQLCQGRRQTVFGTGHPRAHWMIIGEAPGEQEDLQGEPFVGKAGQLLDRMLASIGLDRGADSVDAPAGHDGTDPARQVYIANVLKCRPPNNRNPQPEEVARCEPYLQRQVALVQPRIILAMGRFAVQSLLRTQDPIGRLRGTVHQYEGVPVVVTYHPAYLLRNPLDKARSWEDLCLAAAVLAGQRLEPT